MEIQQITEGEVKLYVPSLTSYQTPTGDYAPSLAPVFYNPHMELSRDLSILAIQVYAGKYPQLKICDPLAGVGVRGIRYAKEVKGVSQVVLNDRSSIALDFIKKNVELNALTNVRVENLDANVLLSAERFDVIDLDPFGSPAPFIDSICRGLRPKGLLLVTATDTAPLAGRGERACFRKYAARPLRTEYSKENGIRILIGFIVREAARFSLALEPVFAHATRHYFRVFLSGIRRRGETDRVLREIGWILHCFSCGRRKVLRGIVPGAERCECGAKPSLSGPLWVGPLWKKQLVDEMMLELGRKNYRLKTEEMKLLRLISSECEGPATFYSLHKLCSLIRASPPRMERILKVLRSMGFFASKTHFAPDGIRTDAPVEEILKIIKT